MNPLGNFTERSLTAILCICIAYIVYFGVKLLVSLNISKDCLDTFKVKGKKLLNTIPKSCHLLNIKNKAKTYYSSSASFGININSFTVNINRTNELLNKLMIYKGYLENKQFK